MKIKLNLENCYGIGKLEKELEFSYDKPIVIHSSNGTMKTSLCKTLIDIQNNKPSVDQVDPSRITTRLVKIDNRDANPDDFIVFKPFEDTYVSQSISKIILENSLKITYDNVTQSQNNLEQDILSKISKVIGQKPEKTKEIYMNAFGTETFSKALSAAARIRKSSLKLNTLKEYKYKDILDKPVKSLAEKDEIKTSVKQYNTQYKRMLNKSLIFTSGIFEISNLNNVSTSLKAENYFKGKNKLLINNVDTLIETEEQLDQLIQSELSNINSNPKVQASFKTIVDTCGNQKNLTKFFEVLKTDKVVSKQYSDIQMLEKRYLSFHLAQFPDEIEEFLSQSKLNKKILKSLINQANRSVQKWQDIIEEFKGRFSVPYSISISNKANAILGIDEPIINFSYETNDIEEKTLVDNVLSSSEKRAYYILQILFEIERSKNISGIKILVFDDIADSFDYTNKYAIIEYLSEISNYSKFRLLLLTHNFDFYRSFGLKVATRDNCFFALKDKTEIIISQGEYLKNLFQFYKTRIGTDNLIDLTIIGFARNLKEYYVDNYDNDTEYLFYTSLVHYRPHAAKIKLGTLYSHYNTQFSKSLPTPTPNNSVYKTIMSEADTISVATNTSHKIEEKIVVSLATKIRCEKYLYKEILKFDTTIKTRISLVPLGELLEEYKTLYPTQKKIINICKQIGITTPYHIHINSFMYEPMVDISINNLRHLYIEAKNTFGKF